MKAVNLIPEDLRGAGAGAAGRTGPAVYVLLGALGVLVVVATAWAVMGRTVTTKQNDLAAVTAEAQTAEARAGALAPYAEFAAMRAKRVETVQSLSRTRFNWPYALREISRVLPKDVWLTTLNGTVAPGVRVEGGAGTAAASLRGALSVPAVELAGCTTDQRNVARLLARLRSVDGVTRVSLATSEKASGGGAAAGPSAGGSNGGDCRQGSDKWPKFDLVVFFERSTAKAATAGPGQPSKAAPVKTSSTSGSTK